MNFAAILAGGIGNRMELKTPKQFKIVGNKPILIHSINIFLKVMEIDKIIVSSPKDFINETKNIIYDYLGENDKIIVIEGGKTRNETILNSIKYVKKNFNDENPILVTHDAARIFATPKMIKQSINVLNENDASCPVIPAVDVIFESKKKNMITDIPLRKFLVHAQTPQAFKIDKFLEIYNTLSEDEISKLDEAMALFFFRNAKIGLFEGNKSNFKITYPIDLEIAEVFLKHMD